MSADDSIPLDIRLDELISGEGSDVFWTPQVATPEQDEARQNLVAAVRRYERAFGLESTLQQLALLCATARTVARKNAAMQRLRDARAFINAAAAAAREDGDEERAKRIEAQETPPYPQRDDDMRELGYVQ